jgi:hypothetical protein
MTLTLRRTSIYFCSAIISLSLIACAGDPMESGLDPFAPMVFKEGATAMALRVYLVQQLSRVTMNAALFGRFLWRHLRWSFAL